jgi:hypothetical protein
MSNRVSRDRRECTVFMTSDLTACTSVYVWTGACSVKWGPSAGVTQSHICRQPVRIAYNAIVFERTELICLLHHT